MIVVIIIVALLVLIVGGYLQSGIRQGNRKE